MKKMRMSIDDIHAMVGSIRANVVNMRVTNIYDIQVESESGAAKTYILKLHQPPFPKVFLLLESGVRFHTSKYARDAKAGSALPSQFTMKLRKHLRGKRLSALTQLEGDRVVDFTFGQGALQCHLILELYSCGNIILTDDKYCILSLLRTHRFDEKVKIAVKQVYPVQLLGDKEKMCGIKTTTQLMEFVKQYFKSKETSLSNDKTQKKRKTQTIKQLLLVKESTFGGLGPVIIEHCLVSAGISPTLKVRNAEDILALGMDKLALVLVEIQKGWELLERLQHEQTSINGPILIQDQGEAEEQINENAALETRHLCTDVQMCGFIILKDFEDAGETEMFEEFAPYLYAQHQHKKVKSFQTFDEAVDEYFSRYEAATAEVAKKSAQTAAENKLVKLKKNQQQQIVQLQEIQEQSSRHAQLIELNQQDVENVLLVIRSALASGMDWRGLEELVRYEQKNGNPVANLIHQLDLARNRVAVLLCDADEEVQDGLGGDGTGEEDKKAHIIWIDLSISALANAREIYTKKKKAGEKVKKATEATDKAIALAEKNTIKTLEKQQTKRNEIYQRRKTLWFEKFHWFLSSEKYLVVAGKDAHQNELLVKRYLRKGDVYVHADLHGAATCIVRNHVTAKNKQTQDVLLIPVATLEQAGCMSVCRSSAWSNQVIAGAYWVHADQVSKTAPTGEYLTTGSFMVRGKKNFIQPSRLEVGLAILFRIDESCVNHHSRQVEESALLTSDGVDEEDRQKGGKDVYSEGISTEKTMSMADKSTAILQPALNKKVIDNFEKNERRGEDAAYTQQTEREGKKRLSAKERRDLKKGKTHDDIKDNAVKLEIRAEKSIAMTVQTKNVRGKKGKMKKMKKKYADQDDEDRRLRMEALGHVVEQEGEVEARKKSVAVDESNDDAETEASEEYIRQQREKKEKFLDEQEAEAENVDFFDAFTGEPGPNDIVLFAMPMCAPYTSLTKFKYKVKLTPGGLKKGKAAKQAMEYFFSSNLKEEKNANRPMSDIHDDCQPDVNPVVVQREHMRCIAENELINCMVGPVKISAPGIYSSNAKCKKGGVNCLSNKAKKNGNK